jgi:arylsulfatase A-like enzyme
MVFFQLSFAQRAIRFAAALACLGLPALWAEGPAKPIHRPLGPNIVLILADDLGWGDLSCQPQDLSRPDVAIRTPNIDRLASQGARCTQAYATCCVCAPSRAGLLTGRYQQKFGFYEFVECEVGIPKDELLLPEFLKRRGYAAACIGKWHVGYKPGFRPLDRGFDRFFGFLGGQHDYYDSRLGDPITAMSFDYDAFVFDQDRPLQNHEMDYLTDELTRQAIAWTKAQVQAGKPFFLYLPYNAPHPPMQATWEKLEPYAKARGGKFNVRDEARAMIQSLDDGVGQLMTALDRLGISDNTLVIFTSDNGGADDGPGGELVQHNGGLRPRKGFLWEGGIRIPFIVRWPGRLPQGKVYDQPVSHLDIFATVAAALRIAPPKALDGVDLLPFLNGKKADSPHPLLFWGFPRATDRWAVRSAEWKLVHDIPNTQAQPKYPNGMELGLYDLTADPKESNNLAAKRPEIVDRLRRLNEDFYATLPASIATPQVLAEWQRELQERRQKLPNSDSLRRDGAPGHWNGQ